MSACAPLRRGPSRGHCCAHRESAPSALVARAALGRDPWGREACACRPFARRIPCQQRSRPGSGEVLARSCCQRRQCRQGTRRRRAPSVVHGLHDVDIQLRAGLGLNKGEAHHALKDPLRIGCRGGIRDRASGARHFRIAGFNLLAAIIVCRNTEKLGHAARERETAPRNA
ncbi:MAG: Tn3 family transposase [Boseongicola sp. SB0675_bin_26]|nr:Tn3 family transposase [Boseongicola sp. SB0675_bin_26]